jgi:hypothetical protein
MTANDKIEKACKDALAHFEKLGDERFYDIRSKLEFVLGSYGFDRNPIGLYEFALKSVEILENYKEQNTKKVPKKLLDSLHKAINDYAKANQR